MPADAIKLRGFRELSGAFRAAGRAEARELNGALREAVEPVRGDAEALARSTIPNIGDPWSQMRIGITTRVVYVAPRQRGRSGNPGLKRPNLVGLLLGRSMQPALDRNVGEVETRIEHMLDTIGSTWGAD